MGIYTNSDLNIVLQGNNKIVGQSYYDNSNYCTSYGMDIGGALTFSGNGSLEVSSANCDKGNSTSAAICARGGDITIAHDCTIIAYCGTSGNIKAAISPAKNGSRLILDNAKVTGNKELSGEPTVVAYNVDSLDQPESYKYLKIEPAVTKTVTVNNGTGSGDYAEGESVAITADAPAADKQFKEWTGVDSLNFTGGTSKTDATATFTMPAQNVTFEAVFDAETPVTPIPATYTITFDGNGATAGTMVAQTFTENVAQALTQNAFTRNGYTFVGWNTVADGSGTSYTDKQHVTIGAATTLYAQWTENLGSGESGNPTPTPSTGGNNSKPKYTAKVDKDVENGNISFSQTRVKAGRTVTITVTPDAGYELDKLVILDKNDKEVKFKDNGDGTFTFTMPSGGVEVEPFFEKIEVDEPTPDQEEPEDITMVLYIDQLAYLLNGEPKMNDIAPTICGERTMLPIRVVAENLGATVTWNEADQSVTIVKGDLEILIYIGQSFALVNGNPVELDSSAFITNDRTYLPLRFVAEHLGATVNWDGNAKTVTIILK